MYTTRELAPYLGIICMMLEKLGGEFTYNLDELHKVAFENYDKAIYQVRNVEEASVTIRLAPAQHVEYTGAAIEVNVDGD